MSDTTMLVLTIAVTVLLPTVVAYWAKAVAMVRAADRKAAAGK